MATKRAPPPPAAGGGRAAACCNTLHRVLGSESWPVILDYTEDRVASRALTATLVAAVFLFILRIVAYPLFLMDPVVTSIAVTGSLASLDAGRGSLTIGPAVSGGFNVKFTDIATQGGITNATVTLALSVDQLSVVSWAQRFGFEGTFYDYTGLPAQGRYSLPGFVPRALTTPVVKGTAAITDSQGYARWRTVRMEMGLPGRYSVDVFATGGKAQDQRASGGKLDFVTEVARIMPVTTPWSTNSTSVAFGQRLPPLTVQLLDQNGAPLHGKRAVIISAPPTPGELSSLASRPDVLQPRFAAFDADTVVSTASDYRGYATFTGVRVLASTLSTVVAEVVCDGVRATAVPLQFTVTVPTVGAGDSVVVSIVDQPDASVMEGTPLATPPRVMVQKRSAAGALTPIVGVRVIALPYKQAGVRTDSLATPGGARELNVIGGTPAAILSNVGSVKMVFNATSNPTNASGIADWAGSPMGFIRHGPAGAYSLTFAIAGLHLDAETRDIDVTSSVASVQWLGRAPGAINTTICNWPVCSYMYGGAYGSPLYKSYVAVAFGYEPPDDPFYANMFPAGPSGYIPFPTSMAVTDMIGRPLAGKSAMTRVRNAATGAVLPAVKMQEFPHAGASVSVLSRAEDAQSAVDEGALEFSPHQGGLGALDVSRKSLTTGNYPSFWRIVAAPAEVTPPGGAPADLLLEFVVDWPGSAATANATAVSPAIPLTIYHLDALAITAGNAGVPAVDTTCAYLEWSTDQPAAVVQQPLNEAQSTSAGAPFPAGSSLKATAYNSLGQPVQLGEVRQYVMDAFGLAVYAGPAGAASFRSEYVTHLRTSGGMLAYAFGDSIAQDQGLKLHPAVGASPAQASTGLASFAYSGILLASNTYIRYGLISNASDTSYPGTYYGACVSQYSPPVPITSNVKEVKWTNAAGGDAGSQALTCLADGSTPVTPALTMQVVLKDGSLASMGNEGTGVALTVVDEELTAYPAHIGVTAGRVELTPGPQLFSKYPLKRVAGDVATSPLMPTFAQDALIYGVVNAFVNPVFASLGHHFFLERNPGNFGPQADQELILFNASAPAGTQFPSIAQAPGMPGSFRMAAFSQGVLSFPSAAIVCKDAAINAITIKQYDAANCPSGYDVFYMDQSDNVFVGQQGLNATMCKDNCGGPSRGQCICGVCVCRSGWDGSASCTVPFDGDGYNTLYSNDAQYSSEMAGMPVIDVRATMEADDDPNEMMLERFPRFLLPAQLTAATANFSKIVAYGQQVVGTLRTSAGASRVQRVADAVRQGINNYDALLEGAVANITTGVNYRFTPQLVDCAGTPVTTARFTPVTPIADRCAGVSFPIFSEFDGMTMGSSTFDTNKLFAITRYQSDSTGGPTPSWLDAALDRRLLLQDVGTGCYRLRFTFAPSGGGSMSARTMSNLLSSSAAVTLGASRPFRVLSPVLEITTTNIPTLVIPINVPLPRQPSVRIAVRPSVGDATKVMRDPCAVAAAAAGNASFSAAALLKRCPNDIEGGLAVYVSAVSSTTSTETPLYVSARQYDCTRMRVMRDPTTQMPATPPVYAATFAGVRFSEFPSSPAGSTDAGASHNIRAGKYRLKFTSEGTTVMSPYEINVVETPDTLEMINATTPTQPAQAIFTQWTPNLVSMRAFVDPQYHADVAAAGEDEEAAAALQPSMTYQPGSHIPMSGVVLTAELVGGPPHSNGQLSPTGSTAVTTSTGLVTFSDLMFVKGRSGLYALRLRTAGVECNVSHHIVYVNITNNINRVAVYDANGNDWEMQTGPRKPMTVVAAGPFGATFRACPLDAQGQRAFASNPVTVRTAYYSPPTGRGANGTVVELDREEPVDPYDGGHFADEDLCGVQVTDQLDDDRQFADVGFDVKQGYTDTSGCFTIDKPAFSAIANSVDVQLVFTVNGVDSAPIYMRVLTPKDAKPISLDELRNKIPIPLGMAIAPLAVNFVYQSGPMAWVYPLGAVASIGVLWFVGAADFLSSTNALRGFYLPVDLTYLDTQDAVFIIMLIFITFVTVVLSLHWLGVLIGACIRRCRKGPLSGPPSMGMETAGIRDPNNGVDMRASGFEIPRERPGALDSFDRVRRYELWRFASSRMPRSTHALLTPIGTLHPALVEVLAHVYARFSSADAAADSASSSAVGYADASFYLKKGEHVVPVRALARGAPTLAQRLLGSRGANDPTVHANQQRLFGIPLLTAQGVQYLRDFLLSVHLGIAPGTLSASSLVSRDIFTAVVAHRAAKFGILILLKDLSRLTTAAMGSFLGERLLTRLSEIPTSSRELPSLTPAGIERVHAAYALWAAAGTPAAPRNLQSLLMTLEPALSTWETVVFSFNHAPPSLVDFLLLFHKRLLSASNGGVLDDWGVWRELRAMGFDRNLRYTPVDSTNIFASPVPHQPTLRILSAIFQVHQTEGATGRDDDQLTYAELSSFRLNVGLPPVRRDVFTAVARQASGKTAAGAASDVTAANPMATLDSNTSLVVGPEEYVRAAAILYSQGVDDHLMTVFRCFGYNDRLWFCGRSLSTPLDAKIVAAATLVDAFDTASAAGARRKKSSSAASAFVSTAIFIPQRMWSAFAVSIILMILIAMLLHGLSNQFVTLLLKAAELADSAPALLVAEARRQASAGLQASTFQFQAAASWASQTSALKSAAATGINDAVGASLDAAGLAAAITGNAQTSASSSLTGAAATSATFGVASLSSALEAASGAINAGGIDEVATSGAFPPALLKSLTSARTALTSAQVPISGDLLNFDANGAVSAQLGDIAMQALTSMGLSKAKSSVLQIAASVPKITAASIAISLIVMILCWVLMFRGFQQAVVAARRGTYPFMRTKGVAAGASKYIGAQAGQIGVTFALLCIVIFAIGLVLSLPMVADLIVSKGRDVLIALLSTALVLRLLEMIVMTRILTAGPTIVYRRLYSLMDVWATFANLFISLITAVLRVILTIPFSCLTLMRTDISPLPLAFRGSDPGTGPHDSMFLQYIHHQNPYAFSMAAILLQGVRKRRVEPSALTTATNLLRVVSGKPALARESSIVTVDNPVGRLGHADAPSAPARPDAFARTRAIQRWHLAILLDRNPSLRAARVRDLASTGGLLGRRVMAIFSGGKSPSRSRANSVRLTTVASRMDLRSPASTPLTSPTSTVRLLDGAAFGSLQSAAPAPGTMFGAGSIARDESCESARIVDFDNADGSSAAGTGTNPGRTTAFFEPTRSE